MKKIVLEYDEGSGEIKDAVGVVACYFAGLVGFEEGEQKPQTQSKISEIVNLKTSGFTAQEIIELKQGGMI